MQPFNHVELELPGDGQVVLHFINWRPTAGFRLKSRFIPEFEERLPEEVASLAVAFLREHPDDPASPPLGVSAIGFTQPEGVTASELKRFGWARWIAVADAIARANGDPAHPTWHSGDRLDPDSVQGKIDRATWEEQGVKLPPRPRGRRGYGEAFYEEIARRYMELRTAGVTAPTKRIAEEQVVDRSTAAGWVHRARELGKLPPARRGKAG